MTVKGFLNVWYDPVVTVDRSYLAGGMIGADTSTEAVAIKLSLTHSTAGGSFETQINDLALADDEISGRYFIIDGLDDGGPDDPPERFTVAIERTHIGTDARTYQQQLVQLCGVHISGSAYLDGIAKLVLGGCSTPTRSCGSDPTVRIDGALSFDAGTTLLRNVAVGGTLDCGGGNKVVLQHVMAKGKRVTHC